MLYQGEGRELLKEFQVLYNVLYNIRLNYITLDNIGSSQIDWSTLDHVIEHSRLDYSIWVDIFGII